MAAELKIEQFEGLREILRFRRSPLTYVADMARRGVDVRCIATGRRRLFLVNQPDLIRDVLVAHDWNFIKGPGLRMSRATLLGDGLLTSEGELHRRQRRLLQPGFNHDRLGQYAQDMVECASRATDAWQDGEEYAINQEMARLTLQIVTRCLFGMDIGADAEEVGAAMTEALRVFHTLMSPFVQRFRALQKLVTGRAIRTRHRLDAVLQRIIRQHRDSSNQFQDLLSMLMGASDDANAYISEVLLRDEAMTLFLAGHETTANALTWTWYLLSQHPAVEEKMSEEVRRQLGDRMPAFEDVRRLAYTSQVLCEALRLYPPAWMLARQALTDYRLGTVPVPAGAVIFMSPFATQRDPRYWSDPEFFLPERWSDEVAAAVRPKFAFFPFGGGTRVCIGEHFAMMEGVLVLATIAQRWRLHLVPGQNIEPWPRITLRPRHSIRFKVSKLTPAEASEPCEVKLGT